MHLEDPQVYINKGHIALNFQAMLTSEFIDRIDEIKEQLLQNI